MFKLTSIQTFNLKPLIPYMMSYSDLQAMRQRHAIIDAASNQADDVFNAFAVPACVIASFGFLSFIVCAVFGATLAAVYCLGACFAVFMALFVIAHVARFVLFHAKTWNV